MQIDNTCGSEGVKWEFSFPVKLSKRVVSRVQYEILAVRLNL